jgi:hypothetical protein
MNTAEITEQIKSVTDPSKPRDVRGELGLLSEEEYILLRDITLGGARNERAKGGGPPFVRIGKTTFYPLAALKAYLGRNTTVPTQPRTLVHGNRRRRRSAGGQS